MLRNWILLFALIFTGTFWAQEGGVWIHPNEGQWPERILHKIPVVQGEMALFQDGFGFNFHNGNELYHAAKHGEHDDHEHDDVFQGQFIQQRYLFAKGSAVQSRKDSSNHYRNYFLGDNAENWRGRVYDVKEVRLHDFIPDVDLILKGKSDNAEYVFELSPNASPKYLSAAIEGANSVSILDNGDLIIDHNLGSIVQSKPIAFQFVDGRKIEVTCAFTLSGDTLGFELGEYDESKELIIDPSLTFSSFSGSSADNWGSTATPDEDENVFGGGIAFAQGFPATPGAYDGTFNGGNFDVSILKFTDDGSGLIYATYLGGADNEFPSSMVANEDGELYVLGLTSSANFPTPLGYDNTFGGGTSFQEYGLNFVNGSDIFVTRFSADGSTVLGSTYVGGTGNDGVNIGTLNYNLGDSYRGEITLDAAGDVYVASSTNSGNFPLAGPGAQGHTGAQSAVAFRLSENLGNLIWSRCITGSDTDAGYSVQVASTGEVYVAGGTTSTNLTLGSGHLLTYAGGRDGYVVRLNGATGSTISGTYVGQNEYDQTYFVQLDINDDVYVLGQTTTAYTISPNKYAIPNSGQFIRKFNNTLQSHLWTTMIGAGSGEVEISPTAFLVSDCYDIYLSGWGGVLNGNNSQADFSSSNGLPTTFDAFQGTTNGNNFYIAVLGPNAGNLKYATFFGGTNSSNNHVDGGTSRFDKAGNIYHAVCAACGGNPNGFTSTPGAYSETNNSTNCNIAVFKFALGTITALAAVSDPDICAGEPVQFSNGTQNANEYYWDFGDGNTSTQANPSHQYTGSGTFTVMFIARDTLGCYSEDTSFFDITVGSFDGGVTIPPDSICSGVPYQLDAFGGTIYEWSPAGPLNDPNIPNPTATITASTVFTVIVSDSCGRDTLTVELAVFDEDVAVSNDTTVCFPSTAQLFASGGVSYAWSPPIYLDDPNDASPLCSPDSSVNYTVSITTVNGCEYEEQVNITVFHNPPIPEIDDSTRMCRYALHPVMVDGATSYAWSPPIEISPLTGPNVVITASENRMYYCDFTNACGTITDSIFVEVVQPEVDMLADTIVCINEVVTFSASGGVTYAWFPKDLTGYSTNETIQFDAFRSSEIQVIGYDDIGCSDTAFAQLDLYPVPSVVVTPVYYAIIGEIVELSAVGNGAGGSYQWSPDFNLSCIQCQTTFANPDTEFTYEVTYTDENSCEASRPVTIKYDPEIYIPNTFTPDDNDFNQVFSVVYANIESFDMVIYNRWGELIHRMDMTNNSWDGTYKGKKCPDGVYVWKMEFLDDLERKHVRTGHVTILK